MVDGFSVLRAESTGIGFDLDAFDGRSYVQHRLWSSNQKKYLTLGGALVFHNSLAPMRSSVRAQKQRPVSGADDAE
jgi:hypothetical protein